MGSRRIVDVVHKSIPLSPLEYQVVESPSFQRLRAVKQLGLAHYVFPGANYSRFSHSLGVCHITGQMLAAIAENSGKEIPAKEQQIYRLAGLLHDIGHYPFSHVTERAAQNYYSSRLVQVKGKGQPELDLPHNVAQDERVFKHERLGKEVITHDKAILAALRKAQISPEEISEVFVPHSSNARLKNLISSDLDADRVDYLLRTAHHAGLPYGSIDLNYLVSQMTLDPEGNVCLTSKGMHTAEHVLLSRYYDYQRTNYHKSVAGFELVLADVLNALLESKLLDCRASTLSEMVADESWLGFDDAFIIAKIRELSDKTNDAVLKLKARAILYRRPARLVVDCEFFGSRAKTEADTRRHFEGLARQIRKLIPQLAKDFGLDEALFLTWDRADMALTKVGSHVSLAQIVDEGDERENDRYFQSVRVLNRDGTKSEAIIDMRRSLFRVLSNYSLYMLRLYVLLPDDKQELRKAIRERVLHELPEEDWR